MRPITRRLRLLAAVLGLAQGALPALALAHELAAANSGAAVAHAESLGATHAAAAHSHECGICRNLVSKAGVPPARSTLFDEGAHSAARIFGGPPTIALGVDGPVALPRAPPVG